MKNKSETSAGVQELCRKLKLQLEELAVTIEPKPNEDESRRLKLMEQLKQQLAELST
jgi:hypothetical protein